MIANQTNQRIANIYNVMREITVISIRESNTVYIHDYCYVASLLLPRSTNESFLSKNNIAFLAAFKKF